MEMEESLTVRAKFKVDRTESSLTSIRKADAPDRQYNPEDYETQELRTITMSPVGSNSPENKTFWKYTPSGELKLGTVNPEAWKQFELGQEFYIDFIPAEESAEQKAKRIAKNLT